MPRVSEEYYENKRREIVDAAYRVCTRKPITSLEMKDIITETGYSHGAIYRYYKDLDEILKDLVITINANNKIDDRLEAILAKAKPDKWEETIYAICGMLADYMKEVGTDLLKVSIYSDMLAMTDPERAMNIAQRLGKDEQSPLLYATVATEKFLKDVVKKNKLKRGDLMITTGTSGLFPKDYPIGTILDIGLDSNGLSVCADIQPCVDVTRLTSVIVITDFSGKKEEDKDED